MTNRHPAAMTLTTVAVMLAAFAALSACSSEARPGVLIQRSAQTVAVAPSDDALRAASGCSGCSVLVRSNSVALPLTGRSYVEAKLASSDQSLVASVAYDGATGSVVDPTSLRHAESVARYARQGRLDDELYADSQASSPGTVPVWLWTEVTENPPPRAQLIADSTARHAYEAQRRAGLQAAASPVVAWLDSHGYTTYDRGLDTPEITADVPATALAEMGRLKGLAQAGYRHLTQHTANYWYDTVHTTSAHSIMGNASGTSFCNIDGVNVSSATYLNIYQTFNLLTAPYWHVTWTSELIAGTGTYAMAPSSTFFLADLNGSASPPNTLAQVLNWCEGVAGENYSTGFVSSPPGGLTASDMDFDYMAKNWPYPIITASAGNNNSPGDDTVSNRGYNFLVVGGDDDQSTSATSNDIMASFSSWRNPVTTHGDFELPNLVAPGVNVSSNSQTASGTSASAPITLGAALLALNADSYLTSWPEIIRAVVMATATHPIDPGPNPGSAVRTTSLPPAAGDIKQGAGLLNADALLLLAQPAFDIGPGSAYMPQGYWGNSYNFSTDFNASGQSNDIFNISIPSGYSGNRLRVVMAWDSTASGGCPVSSPPVDCTADTIDADLDLWVTNTSTGASVGSVTWDSSWEMVDLPVNPGDHFTVRFQRNATNATSTFIGTAWYTYNTANE